MTKPRVLVVDDERSIVETLVYNLEKHGFETSTAANGREALQKVQAQVPDVVILDLMLPMIDGLQVCRQIRSDSRLNNVRVLMLTARGDETDEIVGFNMGADDYVAKPFRMRSMIERVKALLRRTSSSDNRQSLTIGDLVIDRMKHIVTLRDETLSLTPTEFRLLWTMARQPGRTFSRNELLDCSRGEDANSMERTIDVHVRSLRKKLGSEADLIETVRGIGYRFRAA